MGNGVMNSGTNSKRKMKMAKVRKTVLKFTMTGLIPLDLKDSKSVLSASKMIESLTAAAADGGILQVEVKEAFGNADIEEAPPAPAADESGLKAAFDAVKPAGD